MILMEPVTMPNSSDPLGWRTCFQSATGTLIIFRTITNLMKTTDNRHLRKLTSNKAFIKAREPGHGAGELGSGPLFLIVFTISCLISDEIYFFITYSILVNL